MVDSKLLFTTDIGRSDTNKSVDTKIDPTE